MITVEYKPNIIETTQATLDFLENRPIMKITIRIIYFCFFILFVGYLLKAIISTIKVGDVCIFLFIIIWLFGHRNICSYILKKGLKRKNIEQISIKFNITKYKLWWQQSNLPSTQQTWQKIKFIYKNKNGYIIPLTGLCHAGQFIWLPFRGFKNNSGQFEDLLLDLNLPIKNI